MKTLPLATHTAALALLALASAGCSTKIPDHLRIEPSSEQEAREAKVQDLQSALATMLRSDPLARSPVLLDPELLDTLEGGPPIGAWVRGVHILERGDGEVQRSLQQLEQQHLGTAVVPLARGYRLRIAENHLAADEQPDHDVQQQIVTLLTPLQAGANDETLPRAPLDWLATGDGTSDATRAYGDRWVLTGWLHRPGVPLEAVGASLADSMYDSLTQTPSGALVKARADRLQGDPEPHLAALRRATHLALTHASADRDSEQARWAELRKEAAEELGVEDPVAALLQSARDGLIPAAADDRATGGALLSIAATRWKEVCATEPCVGLDRVETMGFAQTWSDEIAPLAATWRVIALKEALDTMDVGHETVMYPRAVVTLVDALIGTGAGPLDVHLVRRRSPDPSVWLALARSVGTEGVTQWSEARVALGTHLHNVAAQALEIVEDPELRPLLEQIKSRAIP